MPPKRQDFLKPKPKGKAKTQDPQSENDFLEAADDFEQAAGKWRAGDSAKATRFFNRAIDTYNEGLKRHPRSFDLAYNKANLEYHITEDARIVSHFGNKTALLEETLISHRFAMSLNAANTDILFNAGQVLTSLAEALLESGTQAGAKTEARPLIEEAADLFSKCLESQQQEHTQLQTEISNALASGEYQQAWEGERRQLVTSTGQEDMNADSVSSEAPSDWATVEEPLTPETILETCTAELNALTTLLGLYNPTTDLPSIEKRVQDGMEIAGTRIPALIGLVGKSPPKKSAPEPEAGPTLSIGSTSTAEEATTTPKEDAVLAVANFEAGIAEVTYRRGNSTFTEYAQAIERIFSTSTMRASSDNSTDLSSINTQFAYADALMDLASALADSTQYTTSPPALPTEIEIQWTALTKAQTLLTKLSSAPYTSALSASRLADMFLGRGDTDLFRFRIALLESARPAWMKSRPVLVANAGVFYRGARSYAENAGLVEARGTADAKAIVAEILKAVAGGSTAMTDSWKGRSNDVAKVLEQMVEEGIVGQENVEGVLKFAQ